MYLKLSHNDIVYNSEFLIKDYSLKEIYYNNNLNQADNSASLTIPYDVEIQNFINLYSDSNIKGQIIDGENIVWTGFLRKNYNFGKKQRNTELKIELVSPSYLLNTKTQEYFVLQNTNLGLAVQTLLSKAGFTSTVELTEEIGLFQIHPDTEIKKALTDLLFSYGYCFDFDNEGRFIVFPIFNKPETITQVFDGNNCIDEIKVSKKEQTYNATSVEWELVEKVENKLIFADTTGGNNESNSCSITIQPGEYLGEVDSVGTYYIQYDCAEGKILNVTEGTLTIESTNNSGLTYSYNNLGNQGELSIYNKSSSPITITKLVVYGDAFVVKSTNFAKSSTGTNFKDLKSDYIHNKTFAENLAKNYTDWLNYADYTVNLKSYTDFALGSFVTVTENGLGTIQGRIIEKIYNIKNEPIQYQIEAISEYEPAQVNSYTKKQSSLLVSGIMGKDGKDGIDGKDGESVSITSTAIDYQSSASGTEIPTGAWLNYIPAVSNGNFLWCRTTVNYSDGTKTESYPVSYIPNNGKDGKDGTSVSISSTSIDYQSGTSGTTKPTGAWLNYIPSVANGNYLWCRTTVNFSDGTKTESFSVSYIPTNGTNGTNGKDGVDGKNGVDGKDGKDAVSIKTITEYYLASSSNSGVTISTTGWTETIQTVSSSKKYLWNYEKITFTDNSTTSTSPIIIGNYAADGKNGTNGTNGTNGKGIKSITEYYLATDSGSGVTTATSGFTTTVQSITATKKYLWNYEIITYTDNTTTTTTPAIIGVYGDKGAQGEKGSTGATGPQGATGVRGSLEFSGTEINAISDITEATYTITTASTGIISATMPILVGDTYINVTTQDVWICSTAGTPTTAKWKYLGRRCSDKDDSNRFRMFTPATDNGTMQSTLTKSVVKGENPFGKIDDLLKITNTKGTASSKYTPYSRRTKIDQKKTYRHVTYIKQEDANYIDYIGIGCWETENSFCLSLSGSPINAAYFTSANNFGTLGRWYMVVGYIVANGTTTAPADSGVYDMVTKQKVRDVTNFQWKPNVTYCTNSGCLIRYSASAATKTGSAYLYDVRLDEVNGTEPSLNELLNLDTTTKSKGTWKASTIYNTGDIVYLNGNSYICTTNHTSGTSFDSTKWNILASKGDTGQTGPQGSKGDKGDKGNTGVSVRNKGTWASGVAYVNNDSYIDVVYYATDGCSYNCIKSHTSSSSILPTNTTYWTKASQKGDKGNKGDTGAQGPQGATGAQGVRGAEYRGAFSSNPTSSLVNGDWYLKTGDGYCYYYTSSNSTWNKISSYSDYRYTQAMSDMINLSATLTSNTNLKTAVNAWVQNLVAGTALIEKLFAKSISVGNEIKSSNYSAGSSGFRISSDGNAEFNSGRFRGGLGEYKQVKSWLAHGNSATITIPYDYDITLGELTLTMSYSQYGQQHILGRFLIGKADGIYVTGIELKEGEIYNSNLSITTKSTGTGWYYKSIEYTITNNTGQSIDIYQSILKIA